MNEGTHAARLAIKLRQSDLAAAYIVNNINISYLTGFFAQPYERHLGALVTASGQTALLVPAMEVEHARASSSVALYAHDDAEDAFQVVCRLFDDFGVVAGRLGVEKGFMTVRTWENLFRVLPGLQGEDITDLLADLRLVKNQEERECLRRAGEIADETVRWAVGQLRPGIAEIDLAAEIDLRLKRAGGHAFCSLVQFGEDSALPHGEPGYRTLREGDLVIFDLGGVYRGYCSDITRTVVFGEPSPLQRTLFRAVLQAQQAAVDAVFPGRPLGEVDQAARSVIVRAGYGPNFIHRIGHGLGLEAHEPPSVHGQNSQPMAEGMVFSVEPGIYLPGLGGVRIEDCVIVTSRGAERLTHSPRAIDPQDYLTA